MLMDEPIGALDAKLREEMRAELRRLHIENDSTTVYVTHDQVEAMSMADKIGIMNDGVLQQYDSPTKVYDEPANLFVAQFVGSPIMNVVDCERARRRPMARPAACPASSEAAVLRSRALPAKLHGGRAAAGDLALGHPARGDCGVAHSRSTGCRRAREAPDRADAAPTTSSTSTVSEHDCGATLRAAPPAGSSARRATRCGCQLDDAPHALLRQAQRSLAARQLRRRSWRESPHRPQQTIRRGARRAARSTLDIRDGEFFVLLGPTRRGQDHDAALHCRARATRQRATSPLPANASTTGAPRSATWRWCSSSTRCIRTTRCARTWRFR